MALKNKITTTLEVTCEGPRCPRGIDGKPMQFSWDGEKAKTEMDAIPDDVFRFVQEQFLAEVGNAEPRTFCCRRCQHDYHLDNPFNPKSPRELAEDQANAAKVQQRRTKKDGFGAEIPVAVIPGAVPPPELRDTLTDEKRLYSGSESEPAAEGDLA